MFFKRTNGEPHVETSTNTPQAEIAAVDDTERPPPYPWGVGFPKMLQLHEFGRQVYLAFGFYPYLVGSTLYSRYPRDIDVRLELPINDYIRIVGYPKEAYQPGTRWAALSWAFSLLGCEITGLAIDFQLQVEGHTNVPLDRRKLEIGRGLHERHMKGNTSDGENSGAESGLPLQREG